MKPFVEKQGQWVGTRFDLLFRFTGSLESLSKLITPLATRDLLRITAVKHTLWKKG